MKFTSNDAYVEVPGFVIEVIIALACPSTVKSRVLSTLNSHRNTTALHGGTFTFVPLSAKSSLTAALAMCALWVNTAYILHSFCLNGF